MNKKKLIDYKALFIMGVIFTGTGIVFLTSIKNGVGFGFAGIGITLMIIGGKNKDKWNK